jgi:RNA polymerase sigma factor (sigma-70 family)
MAAADSSDPDALVAALLERWRADRRSGVSEIYHRYARRLLEIVEARMSRSMRGSIEPADIVQTVFGSLLCVVPPADIRRESELLAYLATAARNALSDRHRYSTRQRRDARSEQRIEDVSGFEGHLLRANPTPSEVAMGNETHARFLRALAELPTMQRDVYVEAKLIGCTSAEGAQRLGFPSAQAFRQALARAIAKLTLATSGPTRKTRATEGVTERDG